jgi:hypothetical protein
MPSSYITRASAPGVSAGNVFKNHHSSFKFGQKSLIRILPAMPAKHIIIARNKSGDHINTGRE